MNKIILKQGEEIFIQNSDIKYNVFTDTPIYVSDKVYFSDGDNFFHFTKKSERRTSLSEDFDKLINDIKIFLNLCQHDDISNMVENSIHNTNNSNSNTELNTDDSKLLVEIKKGTVIKMNDLPVVLGVDMSFYIKTDANIIIPEYSDIEIVSRNNILKIINKEIIECKYSKTL